MTQPQRRWVWTLAGALAAIATVIVVYYGHLRSGDAPRYLTAPVTREDIDDTVQATGVLQAHRQVDVGAQVSGQLNALKVKLGDNVRAGQWLAQIDPVVLQNARRQAEAAEESLHAQRCAAAAQLEQARHDLIRQQMMMHDHATSQQDVENASTQLNIKLADVESIDAQLKEARIQVETARTNLGYTRITAPMTGEVVAIVSEQGQTVIAQQQAPIILKLADLDTMTVKTQISEADVVRVRPGLPVHFAILGEPDRRYDGTLRAIEPAPQSYADAQSGGDAGTSKPNGAVFYNALFEVPNADHRLRIAMTADVTILLSRAQHALVIPIAALGDKNEDNNYVVRTLAADGKTVTHFVQVGINNGVKAEVRSGLKEGDTVVIGEPTGNAGDAAPESGA